MAALQHACARTKRLPFRTSRPSGVIVRCCSRDALPRRPAGTANPLFLSCALAVTLAAGPAWSLGMESPDLPIDLEPETAEAYQARTQAQRSTLDAAEDSFKSSNTLKMLLERSDKNREKNRRAVLNKYCYRQAEWGVGDCGGLNLVPGATESGKQQAPEWLQKLLGVQQEKPPVTSKQLLEQE